MNVSGILSNKIPNYIITNAIYLDWQFTIFGLEMFLTNILMISLFRSTNRMEFFSIRKKKSYIMEPYIYIYIYSMSWVDVVGTSLFFPGLKVVIYWWMIKISKGVGMSKRGRIKYQSEIFFSFLSIKNYVTFCYCYPCYLQILHWKRGAHDKFNDYFVLNTRRMLEVFLNIHYPTIA